MSSRVRFVDAADVFVAFPGLAPYAPRPALSASPLDYARQIAESRRPAGAVAFLAHLLPRRESVWWGCKCVEAVMPEAAQEEALKIAHRWVRDPDERVRREALAFIQFSDLKQPSAWLARAAAHSGGSLSAPDQPLFAPAPEACAASVSAAIVLAATAQAPSLILPWLRACAEAGARFVEGGDAKVLPPDSLTRRDSASLAR